MIKRVPISSAVGADFTGEGGGPENPEFPTKSILSAVVAWWNKMSHGTR